MQHKCIEPLGESKSDFQIFADLSKRLGLYAPFTEGITELDCASGSSTPLTCPSGFPEEVSEERLLCDPFSARGDEGSRIVPLVCGGKAQRHP